MAVFGRRRAPVRSKFNWFVGAPAKRLRAPPARKHQQGNAVALGALALLAAVHALVSW